MNDLTKILMQIIGIMDEMATGEIELSIEFPSGKKRSIKIVVDEDKA